MKSLNKETLKIYWKFAWHYKAIIIFMYVVLAITISLEMLWPVFFGQFFEIISQSGDMKDIVIPELFKIIIILAVLEVLHHAGWWLFKSFELKVTSTCIRDLSNHAFSIIQKHSYRFFSNNFSGALIKRVNRFTQSFNTISDIINYDMYRLFLKIIIVSGYLMYVSWILGTTMIVWIILFMSLNIFMARKKLKLDIAKAESDTKVTAELSDSISNNPTVKLFSGTDYEMERFSKATENRKVKTISSWFMGINIDFIQGMLMSILELFVLYMAMQLWHTGLIGIAILFIIQGFLGELFNSIWNFGQRVRKIYEALADSEEMTEIILKDVEIKDKKNAKDLNIGNAKIEFKNICFEYEKNTEKIFENLSLKIKPQEKVAFVGPSGGGKTTLTKLLMRLYDIQSGEILIDGQNIADVKQDSLREAIALVPQDPILFHRSLMENIRYGRRDASDKEIIIASKMARCHDFIMHFKNGYKTFVGERGVKLSGGQRQRVAIARAILSNARILVFDEATSSLDSESEILINEAIVNLTKNKTTIVIAHRLSTIMSSDRVFVIENGKIIEEGQHAELLQKNSGLYQKLWNLQSGGYLDI